MTLSLNGTGTITGIAQSLITSGTAQATTSGTSIDFIGIPSWVKRITVMFNGVSTNGTSIYLLQIGAGSITTTGYQSAGSTLANGSYVGTLTSTSGFIFNNGNSAANLIYGAYRVTLLGSNIWVVEGATYHAGGPSMSVMAGAVTLSGTLDRVRITTVGGTDTFDAGSINILYE